MIGATGVHAHQWGGDEKVAGRGRRTVAATVTTSKQQHNPSCREPGPLSLSTGSGKDEKEPTREAERAMS